jgi:arginase
MGGRYAILEAPSVLGLFPRGVEGAPTALLDVGLADAIGARHAGRVEPASYDATRDPITGLLNPTGLHDYALALADAIGAILERGEIPLVLGGDCSILLGPMLALRRRGRYGLLFIDGHADFYQPEAEPNGEAASMDLALVTGRGPDILTDLEGRRPLVADADVVQFGRRDAAEAAAAGSRRIEETAITIIDLPAVRHRGIARAAQDAVDHLSSGELDGFWIHLDCDVLDDELMPAVDYRLPDGLSRLDLETVLRLAIDSGEAVGLEITIFNPTLDRDGSIARALIDPLSHVLSERR